MIVHSTAYRVYYLVVTVALLLLALFEFPTVFSDRHTDSAGFSEEDIYSTYQTDWLRVSNITCVKEDSKFRCYEVKIEESEKAGSLLTILYNMY